MPGPVDEHADDLESMVHEGEEGETADFPGTGDEFEDVSSNGEDDEPFLDDEDPSEI